MVVNLKEQSYLKPILHYYSPPLSNSPYCFLTIFIKTWSNTRGSHELISTAIISISIEKHWLLETNSHFKIKVLSIVTPCQSKLKAIEHKMKDQLSIVIRWIPLVPPLHKTKNGNKNTHHNFQGIHKQALDRWIVTMYIYMDINIRHINVYCSLIIIDCDKILSTNTWWLHLIHQFLCHI